MLQLGEKFFSGQLALCDGIAGFCAIFNEASYLHEVGAGVGFMGETANVHCSVVRWTLR